MPNIERVPERFAPHDWREGVRRAIEKGVIKTADTVECLEGALGLEPGVLVGAVKEWNEVCARGSDTLPNYPMPARWLFPIRKAPFYGARLGGILFSTHAGLLVTPELKVVDTRGRTILGLYAAFHTAGGSSGELCNGRGLLGGAALSLVGGYIAAEDAIKE
jgi:fumarate reductase flavoprotein subunit